MKKTTLWIVIAALAVPALALAGGDEEDEAPSELFYRAYYLENGLRDFEGAQAAYEEASAAAEAAGAGALHVRTLLGRARCLSTLGRKEEAQAVLGRVLELDPGNEAARAALASGEATGGEEIDQRIDDLVWALAGPERTQAIQDLKLMGDRAVPRLAEALGSRDVGTVQASARALVAIGTEAAYATLAGAFDDPDVVFPNALAPALAAVPVTDPGGLRLLTDALASPTEAVRVAASERVLHGLRGNPAETVPEEELGRFLDRGLTGKSEDVVFFALQSLRHVRPALRSAFGARHWTRLLREGTDPIVSSVLVQLYRAGALPRDEEFLTAVLDAWRRVIRGEVSTARVEGFHAMRWWLDSGLPPGPLLEIHAMAVGPESVLEPESRRAVSDLVVGLIDRLRESDPERGVELALEGYPLIEDPETRAFWVNRLADGEKIHELAIRAVADESPAVRAEAYRGLMGVSPEGFEGAWPHLAEDLVSDDPDLATRALYAAGRFDVRSVAREVEAIARGEGPGNVRGTALHILAKLQGEDALPVIRASLPTDEWESGRAALVEILGVAAVPDLVTLAKRLESGWNPVIRRIQNRSYAAVSGEVMRAYVDALPEELWSPLFIQPPCAPLLRRDQLEKLVLYGLRHEKSYWQSAAAEAAGRYHVADGREALLGLLDRGDERVQNLAKIALEEIRDYLELKQAFARFGDTGRDGAIAKARALLEDENPEKRRGGAYALGALGDPAAVPDLLDLLDDPEASVRKAALEALARLGGAPAEEK